MHRLALLLSVGLWTATAATPLTEWKPFPADAKLPAITDASVALSGDKWTGLLAPQTFPELHVSATVTLHEAAKGTRFFGQGWSAWPDATFSDDGFEAALLLRVGTNSGYRVQLSHRYQCVALVKWPEGGYVQEIGRAHV